MNLEHLINSVEKSSKIDLDFSLPNNTSLQNSENISDTRYEHNNEYFSEIHELSDKIIHAMRKVRNQELEKIKDYYKDKNSFGASELASTCRRKSLFLRFLHKIHECHFDISKENNYAQLDLVCKMGESVHEYFQSILLKNIYDELIDYEIEIPSKSLNNASKSRYDGYCKYNNKFVIVDIKTTKPDLVNTVKYEHILQLHYYYYVLKKDYSKQVDELHILNVARDLSAFRVFNIKIDTSIISSVLGKLKTLQQGFQTQTIMPLNQVPIDEQQFCKFCGFNEFCQNNPNEIVVDKSTSISKNIPNIEILL